MENILIHRFLESMKLPTSTKPTSGFHISDILELNKEKNQKKPENEKTEEKSTDDANCDEVDVELKTENLSCESDENVAESCNKRKLESSPTISRESSPREEKELKKSKRSLKQEGDDRPPLSNYQLLSETMHQYPHLFQNHPAMRQPWMSSNGKLRNVIKILFHKKSSRPNRENHDGADDECRAIRPLPFVAFTPLEQMLRRDSKPLFIDSTSDAVLNTFQLSSRADCNGKHEIDS